MLRYLCTDTAEYIVAKNFLFFKFSGNFITHFPLKFDLSVSVHPFFNLFFMFSLWNENLFDGNKKADIFLISICLAYRIFGYVRVQNLT